MQETKISETISLADQVSFDYSPFDGYSLCGDRTYFITNDHGGALPQAVTFSGAPNNLLEIYTEEPQQVGSYTIRLSMMLNDYSLELLPEVFLHIDIICETTVVWAASVPPEPLLVDYQVQF